MAQDRFRLAIIGGSQGFRTARLSHRKLAPVETPFGTSAPLHLLETRFEPVLFLSRHGETGYEVSAPFVNYRANIWALKALGVERIVAWSGPGAIDTSIPIGDILVPEDLIDETRGRASTFFEKLGIGFVRQNPVFCPELADSLAESIRARVGKCRRNDIYVCTQGPRLETRAEIRKFASYGATLVGMTLAPEAFLARELEMCYCPVCYVSNYAEGVIQRPYVPGELFEGLLSSKEKKCVEKAVEILPEVAIDALANAPSERSCPCSRAMERYRKRGDIGEDWRTWIEPRR